MVHVSDCTGENTTNYRKLAARSKQIMELAVTGAEASQQKEEKASIFETIIRGRYLELLHPVAAVDHDQVH